MFLNFNEEKPTAKQINFAKEIAEELGVELPKEKTWNAYHVFINKHMDKYRESMRNK